MTVPSQGSIVDLPTPPPPSSEPTFPARGLPPVPAWCYVALVALAVVVGIAFLQEPNFGDDFTYWGLAYNLHEIGPHAWTSASFHDLRWPVWSIPWIWQCFFDRGLSAYYCEPIFYLSIGAVVAFLLARRAFQSLGAGWICAIAFVYEPLLDAVVGRAMPDLSETVFSGCAVLGFWAMMGSEKPRRTLLFGILSGLSIGISYSNRVSGVFIAPLLAVFTLLFYRDRWPRLVIVAAAAFGYFCAECAFYHHLTGDWLHSLHTSSGNKDAKGTEALSLAELPTRYLVAFTHGNRLAWPFTILSLVGLASAWRRERPGLRMAAIWGVAIFAIFSLAIQSLHPVRPLIGSASRYMGVIAMPMAILVTAGVLALVGLIGRAPWPPVRAALPLLTRWPLATGLTVVVALGLWTTRPFFNLGFVPVLRKYMAALPPGTKVFTHPLMRNLACLADTSAAKRFDWVVPHDILLRDEKIEKQAAGCQEFWYLRKHIWLHERIALEHHEVKGAQPPLGSYIDTPERDWILSEVLNKSGEPEVVLCHRRPANAPAAHVLDAASPEMAQLLPAFPATWQPTGSNRSTHAVWNVPSSMRGKLVMFQFMGASPSVEPMDLKLHFRNGGKFKRDYFIKPIFFPGGGKEFLAMELPKEAERCEVDVVFGKKTKAFTLTGFRAVYDVQRE